MKKIRCLDDEWLEEFPKTELFEYGIASFVVPPLHPGWGHKISNGYPSYFYLNYENDTTSFLLWHNPNKIYFGDTDEFKSIVDLTFCHKVIVYIRFNLLEGEERSCRLKDVKLSLKYSFSSKDGSVLVQMNHNPIVQMNWS